MSFEVQYFIDCISEIKHDIQGRNQMSLLDSVSLTWQNKIISYKLF